MGVGWGAALECLTASGGGVGGHCFAIGECRHSPSRLYYSLGVAIFFFFFDFSRFRGFFFLLLFRGSDFYIFRVFFLSGFFIIIILFFFEVSIYRGFEFFSSFFFFYLQGVIGGLAGFGLGRAEKFLCWFEIVLYLCILKTRGFSFNLFIKATSKNST